MVAFLRYSLYNFIPVSPVNPERYPAPALPAGPELIDVPAEHAHLFEPLERNSYDDLETQLVADFAYQGGRREWDGEIRAHKAEYDARHDPLTGLANRAGWEDYTRPHREAIEAGGPYGLMHIDLNRFGDVNKKYGQDYGDAVLGAVRDIFIKHTRSDPTRAHPDVVSILAREGGDEFRALFDFTPEEGALSTEETEKRAVLVEKRIRQAFEDLLDQNPHLRELGFGVSIGRTSARPGVSLEQLVKEAEKNMRRDKREQLPKLSRVRQGLAWLSKSAAQKAGLSLSDVTYYTSDIDDNDL